MLAPQLGSYLWVWELSNVEAVIVQAKAMGMRGVLVKAHDGVHVWPQFAASVNAFKHAGLLVGAWGYIYPTDTAQQASLALGTLHLGADFYVADAEVEFENAAGAAAATDFCEVFRRGAPDASFGYTTFALPNYHSIFPYATWSRYCDFVMPQVYWADAGEAPADMLNTSLTQLSRFGKPVLPVGQAYGAATPAEIVVFIETTAGHKLGGLSWWDAQSVSPAQHDALAAHHWVLPAAPVVHEAPEPEFISVAVWNAKLGTVINTLEHFKLP